MEFLAYLKDTGFVEVRSGGETGVNSSPKTRGMHVSACKPGLKNYFLPTEAGTMSEESMA